MAKDNFSRTESGLLTKPPVEYVFNDDGSVNWRKMVRKEFLVPNRQKTKETDVDLLEDKDLLILLGGIKELAQIRGFTSVKYNVIEANPEYVCTSCQIDWIGNYETAGSKIEFQALADAHRNNTNGFAANFLAAIAENRAFTRCVRSFLKINIVGHDEVGGATPFEEVQTEQSISSPSSLLKKVMQEKGVSFDSLKKKLVKEGYANAEGLSSIDDIPKVKIFEIVQRLQTLKK
jgi:hypothetical protein